MPSIILRNLMMLPWSICLASVCGTGHNSAINSAKLQDCTSPSKCSLPPLSLRQSRLCDFVGHKVFYVLNKWHILPPQHAVQGCQAELELELIKTKNRERHFPPNIFSSLPDSSPVKITHKHCNIKQTKSL